MTSGLRNPGGAVRGVGAGALAAEALALLFAVVPLIKVGGPNRGVALVIVIGLATAALVLAGLLRYRWAWYGGAAIPLALLVAGLLFGPLAILGVVFALVWGYVLHVRRSVLSGAAPNG
jgi:Protein of unknown function (DUF4233)